MTCSGEAFAFQAIDPSAIALFFQVVFRAGPAILSSTRDCIPETSSFLSLHEFLDGTIACLRHFSSPMPMLQ